MSNRRENDAWRYLKNGEVVHYLGESVSTLFGGAKVIAECGASVLHGSDWRGTGSQDEYERAARLPECKKCLKKIGRGA